MSAAAIDASGGVFAVAWGGNFWHIASNGSVTGAVTPLASGEVWTSAAFMAGSGVAMSSSGTVAKLTTAGSSGSIGAWAHPTNNLVASGSSAVAALMPSGALVVTMTSGGVSGSITALPTAVGIPACLSVSSGANLAAVGGWQTAPALSGMASARLDPQVSTTMLAVGSGSVVIWTAPGALSEAWLQTQALSGLANLNSVAWRPDGSQALATSVVSGDVQVIAYIASVMSLAQTLAVSGACSVAVAGTSINALVAQSGQAKLATLTYSGSTWTTGTAVTGVTGVTAVASVGPSNVAANYSGGVVLLGLTGGLWSINQFVPLGFAPSALTVDPFLNIYAAGSGALGVISSGGTVLGSGAWSGAAPTAIAVQEGRVILAIPSDGLYRIFAQSAPGAWTQQNSQALALGTTVGLGLSNTVLFAMGSGATNTYGFSGTPFTLTPVTSGAVSQWNGSSWTTTALGIGHNPSSIAYDSSGTVWVSTVQDTYWNLATSGTVLSSGAIPVFSGQTQITPMGASAICPASGHVYIATSLAGTLVEIL